MKRWELLLRTFSEDKRQFPWSIPYIGASLADMDTAFKRFMLHNFSLDAWGLKSERFADGEDHITYTINTEDGNALGQVILWRLSGESCDLRVTTSGQDDDMVYQCMSVVFGGWFARNQNPSTLGLVGESWPDFWEAEATESPTNPTGTNKEETKPNLLDQLRAREREVLQEIVNGLGQKAIADKLDLTQITVKNHKQSIAHKLGLVGEATDAKLRDYGLQMGMKKAEG